MRVLLFQDRFVPKILDGSKVHTIRKTARCRAGDVLSLRRWTGKPYRSKQAEFARYECTRVMFLSIHDDHVDYSCDGGVPAYWPPTVLAQHDGFVDFGEMVLWFQMTHGLPFAGWLIGWGKQ